MLLSSLSESDAVELEAGVFETVVVTYVYMDGATHTIRHIVACGRITKTLGTCAERCRQHGFLVAI